MDYAERLAKDIFEQWDKISKRKLSNGQSGGLRPKSERVKDIAKMIRGFYAKVVLGDLLVAAEIQEKYGDKPIPRPKENSSKALERILGEMGATFKDAGEAPTNKEE